jgi:hypothetical protein
MTEAARPEQTGGESGERHAETRPVILGSAVGAAFGAAFVTVVSLLGGAADWYLLGFGGAFDGALLGAVVGAIIREKQAGHVQPKGTIRITLLWTGIGACTALAVAVVTDGSVAVWALIGTGCGALVGVVFARSRK